MPGLVAFVVGLAAVILATFAPDVRGSEYLGVPIGLLIGAPMRRLVTSWRDVRIPVLTGVIAALCVVLGQLLALKVWSREPNLYVGLEVVVVAIAMTAERLRAFDVGHARQIAHEDMRDLQRQTEEVEARPKPGRIVGGARVRCAECDELVDAATTRRDGDRGVVCPDCL